ncbi:hypothetical protein H7I53_18210 [Mycolicibacterium pulveris]|uniref:Uncharacterized protein n=1 Tax=Mycolicibacterium pulveris TaxID=36813 RepID=A0A7I7URV7_MYCPV|nr:hypothetical protein [Mycolicibacterium pulveris]MCV6982150.1 hypothetical protein [Mycolicibacterium pulveris]BBY78896.1 hypothetical protein MPUL_00540 [Mycolicibacterium pulveris]BBY84204.1 hypothetical protein MPUL_53620 [Mycolicibacterium pulveris]
MRIETTTHQSGLGEIRAVGEFGTLALAIEFRRYRAEDGTYWRVLPVHSPVGVGDPVLAAELESGAAARSWVTYLGELIEREQSQREQLNRAAVEREWVER